MPESDSNNRPTRRDVLRTALRGTGAVGLGMLGASLLAAGRSKGSKALWQIDPYKCNLCGKWAT